MTAHREPGRRPAAVLTAASAVAELVVVGRRGRGGMPGLPLGTTAAAVAQHSLCSVVVIPHPSECGGDAQVLVGVDTDESAGLPLAQAMVRLRGGRRR